MCQRHFVNTLRDYAYGCVQQAEDRAVDRVRLIDDYWKVRRLTSGCFPTFTMIELDLDFPEDVYAHPLLERLRELTMQSVSTINVRTPPSPLSVMHGMHISTNSASSCKDVLSYNVERLRGHELHNLITVVMYERKLRLPDAVAWIGNFHEVLVAEFIACRDQVKNMREEWGEDVSRQVNRYVDGLGEWARGNHCWHFESERYFGLDGPKVREEGELLMLPPAPRDGSEWDAGKDQEGLALKETFAVTQPAGLEIMTKGF